MRSRKVVATVVFGALSLALLLTACGVAVGGVDQSVASPTGLGFQVVSFGSFSLADLGLSTQANQATGALRMDAARAVDLATQQQQHFFDAGCHHTDL